MAYSDEAHKHAEVEGLFIDLQVREQSIITVLDAEESAVLGQLGSHVRRQYEADGTLIRIVRWLEGHDARENAEHERVREQTHGVAEIACVASWLDQPPRERAA